MKENKIYYRKDKNVSRIIRVFREKGDGLTTNEVMIYLSEQKTLEGNRYLKQPKKGTVTQLLSKYPYFERSGTGIESSITTKNMKVAIWNLVPEGGI